MEQYAAADRVEQLGAQRARLKVAEHRREVEALLAAKRAAFEQEQVCYTYGCELHRTFLRFLGWIEPAVHMVAFSTTSYYTVVPALPFNTECQPAYWKDSNQHVSPR